MAHPVQTVLESLYAAQRCPRLHVDATKGGVVCPDFVRDQWRERLVIDLDASYPLELEMDADGLSANLSFGGYVSRCSFPWGSIYVVTDRDTGRGIVLEQNVPSIVREQMEAARQPRAKLAAVDDEADEHPAAEADAPGHADADSPSNPAQAVGHVDDLEPAASAAPASGIGAAMPGTKAGLQSAVTAPQANPEPNASSSPPLSSAEAGNKSVNRENRDDAARRRRAAFRVIDGGS